MEPAIAKMERRERTKNTLEAGTLSLEYPRVRGKRSVRAEVDTNKNHVFRGFKGSAGDPLLIYKFDKATKTNRPKVGTASDRGTHLTLHFM